MKRRPILLIDGDIVAYKAASAVNKSISFDGDNHVTVGSLEEAKVIVEDALASFLSRFKTHLYLVTLSDSVNWRHTIFPPYKANRKGKERPTCLSSVRDYLCARHPIFQRPTLEADDIMGILATSPRIVKHPGEKIIISADKDMKGIPGLFYDMGQRKVLRISEMEANRWHMLQTLMGDTADNYPGCPGIGFVKASRLLAKGTSYAAWWPLVVAAFVKAGLTEEDALTQARVSRILQAEDFDFKKKEVRLWSPPPLS